MATATTSAPAGAANVNVPHVPPTMPNMANMSNMPNMPMPNMPMPNMPNMPNMANMPPMPPNMPPMPPMPLPNMPGAPPMPFPNPMMPGMLPMNPMMFKPQKGKGQQPLDKWAHVQPNNTVYVNNLTEKTSRDEIVNGLREVFGQYGKILDVTCYTKIKRCKGQAWIAFERQSSATKALMELNGFLFFGKPMRVAYSKNVSDATLKRDGKPIPNRVRPPKKKKQKKKIIVEEPTKKKKKRKKKDKKNRDGAHDEDDDVEMKSNHNNTNSHNHNTNSSSSSNKNGMISSSSKRNATSSSTKRIPNLPPNKRLFLQNLPSDSRTEEIESLFLMYPGFIGVNLIENKPGIGFVDFDDTYNSSNALRSLNGYNVRGHDIQVTFAAQ